MTDLVQTEQRLRAALALNPCSGDAVFALADFLLKRSKFDEAERHYDALRKAFPTHPALLNSLAILYSRTGRRQEAVDLWKRVRELQPHLAAPLVNMGLALRGMGDPERAAFLFAQALTIEPQNFDVLYNLGATQFHLGRYAEAAMRLEDALKVRPGDPQATVMLAQASQAICDWNRLDDLQPALQAEADKARAGQLCAISPWFSVRLPFDRPTRKAIAATATRPEAVPRPPSTPRAGDRITIGYMAQDFRQHPGLHLTAGLYRRHDRSRFRVIAYPVRTPDAVGRAVLEGCDRTVELTGLSDRAAADAIRNDGVDVLVDYSVVGTFTRQGILALRPAPVQASWLGFAGTMSGELYDYLIADPVVIPPEHESDYLEKIARLPASYQINNRDQAIGRPTTRAAAGLPESGIVFACFCSADRIERDLFGRWMALLRGRPGSVLWLLGDAPLLQANLRQAARAADVDPARLVFAATISKADHLARFALADLHLDTGTFGAHTTASDALWAGVPHITRLGDTFPARVGASLLHAIGLPELIADDWDGYARLASELAGDQARLAAVRAKLAANRLTTPLFDTDRFVRELESLYESLTAA